MGLFLKSLFFLIMLKPYETLSINKDLSSKVAQMVVPSIYSNSFLKTTQPIELKFRIETPYDRLAKIFTNCCGHMTKGAVMPI